MGVCILLNIRLHSNHEDDFAVTVYFFVLPLFTRNIEAGSGSLLTQFMGEAHFLKLKSIFVEQEIKRFLPFIEPIGSIAILKENDNGLYLEANWLDSYFERE